MTSTLQIAPRQKLFGSTGSSFDSTCVDKILVRTNRRLYKGRVATDLRLYKRRVATNLRLYKCRVATDLHQLPHILFTLKIYFYPPDSCRESWRFTDKENKCVSFFIQQTIRQNEPWELYKKVHWYWRHHGTIKSISQSYSWISYLFTHQRSHNIPTSLNA